MNPKRNRLRVACEMAAHYLDRGRELALDLVREGHEPGDMIDLANRLFFIERELEAMVKRIEPQQEGNRNAG